MDVGHTDQWFQSATLSEIINQLCEKMKENLMKTQKLDLPHICQEVTEGGAPEQWRDTCRKQGKMEFTESGRTQEPP